MSEPASNLDAAALQSKLLNLATEQQQQKQKISSDFELDASLDAELKSNLYCQKCRSTLDFFFDLSQSNSSKSAKYKDLCNNYKRNYLAYKRKLEERDYEYEEIKALKDDYEEKLNKLRCTENRKGNNDDKWPNSRASNSLVPFNVTQINRNSSFTFAETTNTEATIKLNLDLSYLRKQNSSQVFQVGGVEKLFCLFAKVFAERCTAPSKAIESACQLADSLPKKCCSYSVNISSMTSTTSNNTQTQTVVHKQNDEGINLNNSTSLILSLSVSLYRLHQPTLALRS